jgi:hypothetical protein
MWHRVIAVATISLPILAVLGCKQTEMADGEGWWHSHVVLIDMEPMMSFGDLVQEVRMVSQSGLLYRGVVVAGGREYIALSLSSSNLLLVSVDEHDSVVDYGYARPAPTLDGETVSLRVWAGADSACIVNGVLHLSETRYFGEGPLAERWKYVFFTKPQSSVEILSRWKQDRASGSRATIVSETEKEGVLHTPFEVGSPPILEFRGRIHIRSATGR